MRENELQYINKWANSFLVDLTSSCSFDEGEDDMNPKVLQMIRHEQIKVKHSNLHFIIILSHPLTWCISRPQYSVPVVKYDRNGFRPRLRQLIFTQEAAYMVEEAKIKQRIDYSSLKGDAIILGHRRVLCDSGFKGDCRFVGVSVSNLSDNFFILHVACYDAKKKVLWFTD